MSTTIGFKSGYGEGKEMRAPIIKIDEIVFGDLIASGAFGEVYGGTCRGKNVAMKRLPCPEDEEEIEQILNEMEIVINARHPNIVLFMGVCIEEDSGDIIIVQELMDCDLFSYLRKNPITLVEKLHIIMQISEGMSWLHGGDPVILHSDLKPENILMDSIGNAKICDFGLSSVTRSSLVERDGIIGTPLYMGPEALLEESIGKAADVYSFAVVAWAIINVQEPFSHVHDYETLVDTVVYNNERPPISDIEAISPRLADLMNRMWAPKPENRPDFPQITSELKNLIANVALPGREPAQEFWSSQFGGQLEVSYEKFKEKAAEFLGMNPAYNKTAFLCYSEIVDCRKENASIKILNFKKSLDWFGGFLPDENDQNLFDRVLDTFKCPWFYGPITSKQAQAKLGNSKQFKRGTFLVRLNTADNSREEPYRISALGKSGVIHYRVKNKKNVFEISVGKKKIQSPPNIKDCIDVCKKVLKLKLPLPGRDYLEFFENNTVMYAYDTGNMESSDSF